MISHHPDSNQLNLDLFFFGLYRNNLASLCKPLLSLFTHSCFPFRTKLDNIRLKWSLVNISNTIGTLIKPASFFDTNLGCFHLSKSARSIQARFTVLVFAKV